MILQYEILAIGLKSELTSSNEEEKALDKSVGERFDKSMFMDDPKMMYKGDEKEKGLYNKFANYFCDEKENLKDIMQQLGILSEDETRIKEELFMLLYFFIMTFEKREDRIRNIISKNKDNLVKIIENFEEHTTEEENKNLMQTMLDKLS